MTSMTEGMDEEKKVLLTQQKGYTKLARAVSAKGIEGEKNVFFSIMDVSPPSVALLIAEMLTDNALYW